LIGVCVCHVSCVTSLHQIFICENKHIVVFKSPVVMCCSTGACNITFHLAVMTILTAMLKVVIMCNGTMSKGERTKEIVQSS